MALTDRSAGYINPAIAALSVASMGGNKITLKLPGGEVHVVDGIWRVMPNGAREFTFVPGKGMVNPVNVEPPSPIKTAPRATRMPANTGLRLSGAGAISSALALAYLYSEWSKGMEDWGDRVKAQEAQDKEVIGFILISVGNELDPLAQPAQNLNRRRGRKNNPNEKRVRIYGFSRRTS